MMTLLQSIYLFVKTTNEVGSTKSTSPGNIPRVLLLRPFAIFCPKQPSNSGLFAFRTIHLEEKEKNTRFVYLMLILYACNFLGEEDTLICWALSDAQL